jgi:hypothetical protein
MELVAAQLAARGNVTGSRILPTRLYIGLNSPKFLAGHKRTLADVQNEVTEGCLRPCASRLIEMVPACVIKQSAVPKKTLAHMRIDENGVEAEEKSRRISDKKSGTDENASTNAFVNVEKVAKIQLTKLDDAGKHIVAMCAMAAAMNELEVAKLGGAEVPLELLWHVFMAEGDVKRAYRNLASCPTEVWKSMLYVVFPEVDPRVIDARVDATVQTDSF